MKISTKLLTSFILIAVVTVTVGVVGIVGLRRTDKAYTLAIDFYGKPLAEIARAIDALENTRIELLEIIVHSGKNENISAIESKMVKHLEVFETNIAIYEKTITQPSGREIFGAAMKIYEDIYKPTIMKIIDEAKKGATQQELEELLAPVEETVAQMSEGFSKTMAVKVGMLDETSEAGSRLADNLFTVLTVISIAGVAFSVFLGFYIARMISKPMVFLAKVMSELSRTGNFKINDETERQILKYKSNKDESGQMSDSFASVIDMMQRKLHTLEAVSTGDLTTNIEHRSESDSYANAMQTMVDQLSIMFGEIHTSTAQVSVGAKQVADGAQALAQGSTEQASSIEELSASISEIAERTKANARTADDTSKLSKKIMDSAEKGNRQMDQMITAVGEINDASQSIGKIIKTIDDIAFQTNILALNAAVEAARAGQHGKGFAVVAEEVRNLAAKSAQAAKDTGSMIQNSMDRAQFGSRIAGETASSLTEIVEGINESGNLVAEIAKASEEQSLRIEQINIGIDQVAQVIQQNSATAQQSAAASEEMSSQSAMLEELISQFRIKDESRQYKRLAQYENPAERQADTPVNAYAATVGNSGGIGKY